ncbi:hypothetical protein ROS217_03095 [Roseovarius sp. 217]|nr:hypothetical protein ROS217_03095 [Roseovarius sp. 217]
MYNIGLTFRFWPMPWRSVRHTGDFKANSVWALIQQTANVGDRDVAFDHIAAEG